MVANLFTHPGGGSDGSTRAADRGILVRGLALQTQEVYVVAAKQMAEHYRKSPDHIREDELRQ